MYGLMVYLDELISQCKLYSELSVPGDFSISATSYNKVHIYTYRWEYKKNYIYLFI